MRRATGGLCVREQDNEFTRLEKYANIFRPPPVKFKDLEAVVTSRLVRDQVKFDYRFDFLAHHVGHGAGAHHRADSRCAS